ncbi:Protein goliath [Vanrija pseudolonga]|uniref:Protein goliath n=1 Tax=Vanrija pseudolonga TaxID=143232 RepID=A0AAF0YGH2_9TREE|nr:Protein goliath [Vanrija pseudolonga]WOO84590.1 Protein goliath [Vanrija pseudolonga]
MPPAIDIVGRAPLLTPPAAAATGADSLSASPVASLSSAGSMSEVSSALGATGGVGRSAAPFDALSLNAAAARTPTSLPAAVTPSTTCAAAPPAPHHPQQAPSPSSWAACVRKRVNVDVDQDDLAQAGPSTGPKRRASPSGEPIAIDPTASPPARSTRSSGRHGASARTQQQQQQHQQQQHSPRSPRTSPRATSSASPRSVHSSSPPHHRPVLPMPASASAPTVAMAPSSATPPDRPPRAFGPTSYNAFDYAFPPQRQDPVQAAPAPAAPPAVSAPPPVPSLSINGWTGGLDQNGFFGRAARLGNRVGSSHSPLAPDVIDDWGLLTEMGPVSRTELSSVTPTATRPVPAATVTMPRPADPDRIRRDVILSMRRLRAAQQALEGAGWGSGAAPAAARPGASVDNTTDLRSLAPLTPGEIEAYRQELVTMGNSPADMRRRQVMQGRFLATASLLHPLAAASRLPHAPREQQQQSQQSQQQQAHLAPQLATAFYPEALPQRNSFQSAQASNLPQSSHSSLMERTSSFGRSAQPNQSNLLVWQQHRAQRLAEALQGVSGGGGTAANAVSNAAAPNITGWVMDPAFGYASNTTTADRSATQGDRDRLNALGVLPATDWLSRLDGTFANNDAAAVQTQAPSGLAARSATRHLATPAAAPAQPAPTGSRLSARNLADFRPREERAVPTNIEDWRRRVQPLPTDTAPDRRPASVPARPHVRDMSARIDQDVTMSTRDEATAATPATRPSNEERAPRLPSGNPLLRAIEESAIRSETNRFADAAANGGIVPIDTTESFDPNYRVDAFGHPRRSVDFDSHARQSLAELARHANQISGLAMPPVPTQTTERTRESFAPGPRAGNSFDTEWLQGGAWVRSARQRQMFAAQVDAQMNAIGRGSGLDGAHAEPTASGSALDPQFFRSGPPVGLIYQTSAGGPYHSHGRPLPLHVNAGPSLHTRRLLPMALQLTITPEMGPKERQQVVCQILRVMLRMAPGQRRSLAASCLRQVKWCDVETDNADMERDECCAVCQDDYEPKDDVAITPCKHMYHASCLDKWHATPAASTCPMCRRDLAAYGVLAKVTPEGIKEAHSLWMAAVNADPPLPNGLGVGLA